jgi:hypothetical protein
MSTPDLNDLQLRPYPETEQDFHHIKQAAECVRERAEEWYMQTRKEVGDSRLRLEPLVLKPLQCDDCASAMGATTLLEKLLARNKSQSELIPLLPINPSPNRVRFYDRSSRLLYLERHETPPPDWFSVTCSMCGQRIDSKDGDDIIRVGEESFEDYFGLPNQKDEDYTPRSKPRGTAWKREQERVVSSYGARCFECGAVLTARESLTLDHIIARAKGGTWETINLQPLCRVCQNKKADLPVETVVVALDMRLRPSPSDSYDGPVW